MRSMWGTVHEEALDRILEGKKHIEEEKKKRRMGGL